MALSKGKAGSISIVPRLQDNSVVSGTVLSVRISKDGGDFAATANPAVEVDQTNTPGVYRIYLNSTETQASKLAIHAMSGNQVVYFEEFEPVEEVSENLQDALFLALYKEASTDAEKALQSAFLNKVADSVLLRTQSQAELANEGKGSLNSLLGVLSLMTQGQVVTGPDCNGQYWLYANSAVSGQPNLGSMHVVYKDNKVTAILPHSGPNSVEQSGGGCSVEVHESATVPGTFLPLGGCS